MEREVYILDRAQVDFIIRWSARERERGINAPLEVYKKWIIDNPCPLPPSVKVLTEEEIEETKHDDARMSFQGTPCFAQERLAYDVGHRNGYIQCLTDLNLT